MVNISNRLLRFTQLGTSTKPTCSPFAPACSVGVLIKLLMLISCGFIIANCLVYSRVIIADVCCFDDSNMHVTLNSNQHALFIFTKGNNETGVVAGVNFKSFCGNLIGF